MANNNIVTRFTEYNYATKQEVIHELKTPLIDSFWKMIVNYRNEFAKPLGVFEIDRSPITYCACPAIEAKIEEGKTKLFNLAEKYASVSEEGNDRMIYKTASMIAFLKELAKKENLQVDDNFLRMVINKNIKNGDAKYETLTRYIDALHIAQECETKTIDEDLLASLYSTLSSSDELVALYRESDFMSAQSKVIIDRLYKAAPANLLPSLMADYLKVVNSKTLPTIIKAAVAYYFIVYIKPFDSCNEEIAAILTKLVLSDSELGEAAFYLNIEKLFSDLNERVQKTCIEVQKNNDFTYFLDMYIKLFNDCSEKEIARLNDLEAMSLKEEYYEEAMEEAKQSPEYEEPQQYVEPSIKLEETKAEPKVQEPAMPAPERNLTGLAISSLPPVLDEKEAQRLEEHLLETDPELKHSQAYFYARHCTMGKRYTINQFKKEVGCAYETARTSMDALASLGYYRQEMVKNKKVYTPIKRN